MERLLTGRWIRGIVFAGVILQTLFLVASFPHASFDTGEAWFGGQAYREAHGVLGQLELPAGIAGGGWTVLRHQPLVFVGDLVVRTFGFSLSAMRAVAVCVAVLLVALIFAFPARRRLPGEPYYPFAALVLLCCPPFLIYARVYRPEMLLALFGFASFLFVSRGLERGRTFVSAIFAGIAADLAILTHPAGMMFVAAGLGTFLLARKLKESAVFLAVSAIAGVACFHDAVGSYALFAARFSGAFVPLSGGSDNAVISGLTGIAGISALFAVSLAGAFREKRAECGVVYPYTLLLVVLLALMAKHITVACAVPVLPFFALGIANSLSMMERGTAKIWKPVAFPFVALVVLYAGYGVYFAGKDVFADHRDVAAENALIASSMTPGTKVLAPGRFIYNEIGRFEIKDLAVARSVITQEKRRKFNLSSLCEYAMSKDFDYILLDPESRAEGNIEPERVLPRVWGYEALKGYTDGTLLLRRAGGIR